MQPVLKRIAFITTLLLLLSGCSMVRLSYDQGPRLAWWWLDGYVDFDRDHWYKVRLRVTEAKVQAWLDGKSIVDVKIAGRKLSIRSEVEPSRPLGLSTWLTKAAVRNIEIRRLPAESK